MHKNKQPKKFVASKQVPAKPFDKVLIDDVVQHIFSYLPVRARAKFGEVSSQWKKISRRPSLWLAVEMAFISRADRDVKRKKDINSTRHLISLAAFLYKYCTSLEDLHLSYDHHPDMTRDRLDAFFQIKSLKRVKISELSPQDLKHEYFPSLIPACTNLELLNFDVCITVEATKKLFLGLKNLKELYVPNARIDFFNHKDVFSLATKLERLALKYYSMPADLLVKTCPSLRYIMYYRSQYGKDSDSEDDGFKPIEVVGNTVAVRPEGFEDESLQENYKLLAPILVPYLFNKPSMSFLAALATHYYHNKEIIKYLVQEKNFDLHYECPKYTYRESFQWHTSSFFANRLKFKFPLDAAIEGYWRDVESVKELIELGCSAECPKEGYSFLTQAKRADVRMLLIQRGADPNKIVEVDLNDRNYSVGVFRSMPDIISAPAFVFHFIDASFEDSEEFVLSLKGRVDFNIEVKGETMLGWAIRHKKWNSIYALLKLGYRSVRGGMQSWYALTNGKVDEAKIRQAQMKEKADNEEATRQRQEINNRLKKMMEEGNPPWLHVHPNGTSSDEDRPNSRDEDSSDRENNLWGSNSDSEEHGHRNFFDISSDESHEPFFDEFSDGSSSEVEESEIEEEAESSEENSVDVRGQLPAKLRRLYDSLVEIQKIIQDRESFSVKAFQKQLTRDIFPAYITNSNRKRQLKSATDEAESKDLFKALLKRWIENFLTEFRHEVESMASKSTSVNNKTRCMDRNKQAQKKHKAGTSKLSTRQGSQSQSQSDLNNDVLRHIFSFLPPRTRGKIAEVSKKWCHASRDPFSWPVVEITFKPTKRDDSKYHLKRVRSLIAFLQKYCTSLVDLNLCCEVIVRSREILEEVFQIKSLRRLKIKVRTEFGQQPEFLPSKNPACLGLELLNLELQTSTNYVRSILTSLPNLKEVYLPYFSKVFVFSSPKLERLGMQSLDNVSATRLVTANPSLKFLVICRNKVVDSSDSDSDDEYGTADGGVIQRVNNALIVRAEALQLHNIKRHYKELAPLIMPYMANNAHALLPLLSLSYQINKEVIKYLVQEQGFDVNYIGSEYTYRPSFQNFDRFEAIISPVLQSNPKKVEPVQELLALGANAECPDGLISYLNTPSAAVRVLLLKHGANPNKIVNIRPPRPNTMFQIGVPVYVAHFVNSSFDDSEEFVLMLKDKVDLNAVVQSKSLLQWAIELKKWASVSALISLGVKWNDANLSALLKGDKNLFQQLLVNKTIDVNQLSARVVIDAIHENMTPYLAEYLKVNIDKKNEYGYTLLHFLATSWPRNNAKKEYKNNPHRWIVSGPVTPTNEPTRQKLRFKHEMEAVNHAMGRMRNAVATTEPPPPSKNAQSVPVRQVFVPHIEVGKKRKRDNDRDHHYSSSDNEELMEIESEVSDNLDDKSSNDSASDNDDNDNFYGVPRSALTIFQQRPPPMIKPIESISDSSSDSSESEKPVNRGKKRPRKSSSESEDSVSDNEDNAFVPRSAIQSFRESLDEMVQEKKRKRVDSSSSSEDDEEKLSGIPRIDLERIRESLRDEQSSIPKHVDDEVMENMRRYHKEKNYFKEDSPTDDNGVPRDFVRQLIADNNTNRKKKVASDDEVSDDFEDRRFIHASDEKDAHYAAFPRWPQKTQQQKSVAKSQFNGSDVDFDWPQLFKSCQPAVNAQSNDGETALLLACKSYISDDLKAENVRLQRVQELLANGADVNIADDQGWTPLHAACYAGDRDVALALIKANANVNAQDKNGITPIMAAVYGWHHVPKKEFAYTDLFGIDLLALLKEMKGVDFSLTEKHTNRTILHMISTIDFSAATFGEILDHLRLQNLKPRDVDGFTPLHYATMYGANNVIKKLVEFGCDINCRTTAMRITPAMIYLTIIASDFTPQKPYKICLEYCAMNFLSNRQYKDIMQADNPMVIEAPWNFKGEIPTDHRSNHAYTTLTYVPDTLAFFLKNSDLTLVDSCGNNYLHYLVLLFALSPEEVQVCCKKYPALNSLWNQNNSRNTTPFHMWTEAIGEYPTDEAVKIIIDIIMMLDIDITEIYGDGRSIFSWICTTTHFHCKPEEWSELGAKIDFTKKSVEFSDKNALTTMMAESTVPSEIISFISKRNPQLLVSQRDRHGRTLLIQEIEETAQDGEFQTEGALFDLLKMKELINQQDNNGDTALHIACKYFTLGFIDSINGHIASFWTSFGYNYFAFLLLDAGADPTIKNNYGETPLSYVPRLMEYYEELYKKWFKELIESELKSLAAE